MRTVLTALAIAISPILAGCATTSTETSSAAASQPASPQQLLSRVNIPYETFTLDNGLRVIVHEDRKAPVVAVSIWYNVGSKDEPAGRTGFAHLFEHIMFNGSENAPGEYFDYTRAMGATDLNGTTWFDRTNYFETVPTGALDRALFLESDRMGHLLGAITQAKLDEQRGVVQNEKREGDNQPYGRVEYSVLAGLLPAAHPYRHSTIGSMEDLDAAALGTVQQWFKDYYGAANAVLVIAGDVRTADAHALAEKYFGDIAPGPTVNHQKEWVAKMSGERRSVMQDRVPQARIYKVWNIPGYRQRDFTLMDMTADLLANGKNSRLYKRLVYTDRIATGVSADIGLTPTRGSPARPLIEYVIPNTPSPRRDTSRSPITGISPSIDRFSTGDGATTPSISRLSRRKS